MMNSSISLLLSRLALRKATSIPCRELVFNMMVADITRKSPIKITKKWLTHGEGGAGEGDVNWLMMLVKYNLCLEEATQVMGYCPLQYTHTRADPLSV